MHLADVQEEVPGPVVSTPPERAGMGSIWRNERARSVLVVVLIVLVANSIYLLHVFNPNPINQVSGLGTITQAGPLPGADNIDPNIGFTAQALGHRAAVDWLHGDIPWWNPYEGVGAPLAGEMQGAAFFPLDAFNLLPDGQVYFRVSLEILAGIGTYLLLRRFTRSNLPAIVGGAAFALNGTFSWMFHAPGNPIAFLPFLILGGEWAREGALDRRRRGWILIAVALALSVYAGFPEVAFIDALLALLWFAVRSIGLPRRCLATFAQSLALGAGRLPEDLGSRPPTFYEPEASTERYEPGGDRLSNRRLRNRRVRAATVRPQVEVDTPCDRGAIGKTSREPHGGRGVLGGAGHRIASANLPPW